MRNFLSILIIIFAATWFQGCSEQDKPTIGLYVAIKRGDIDQIERHIFWKTDINQLNIDGQTPLHESARAGRLIVAKLLLNNGADPNKLNLAGKTALFLALKSGRVQLAELLIDKYNAQFDPTAALFDIVNDNVSDRDVIRLLVQRGAQINSHDETGNTPLIIAINNQQRLVAKHLIDSNADVNFTSKDNQLPLAIARQINNPDLITLLARNGARESNNP